MWQLSWMLGLLPNWFWTLVLICGVVGILASWVLKFIPFVSTYRLPIQVGSIIALLVGVYFQGFNANEEKWQARIKELEEKVRIAEEKSKETNVKIEEKIVYKDRVIREKAKTQIEYIDREIVKREEVIKFVEQCPIPQVIIEEHNKAATREVKK